MNKTVEDLKMEIEEIKKTQTEGILETENLGKEQSNRYKHHRQDTGDGGVSSIDVMTEEIDTLVKDSAEAKMFLTQSIQKIWDTMKRTKPKNNRNRRRKLPVQRPRKYPQQNNRAEFPNLKKERPKTRQEAHRTPNRSDQRKPCHHTEIKNTT